MTSVLSSTELFEIEDEDVTSDTTYFEAVTTEMNFSDKFLGETYKIEDPLANSNDKILRISKYRNSAWIETSAEDEIEEWPVSGEFQGYARDLCLEFCNSHGLINALRLCISKIKEEFSGTAKIHAELDYFEDNDIVDEGHIVIRVFADLDDTILMEKYNKIVDWFVDTIEVDKQSLLILSIE